MAGETVSSRGICLRIRPWSRTSHIVSWLTARGIVSSVVKGAIRPKSFFLGQYDLNYTCDILYYARAKGELHALKECVPFNEREHLRYDYLAAGLADYFRELTRQLCPEGDDAKLWFESLENALDDLKSRKKKSDYLASLIAFELKTLALSGFSPNFGSYDHEAETLLFSVENGSYDEDGGHLMRLSAEVVRALEDCEREKNSQILLDAARVIGVFYNFHLDCARTCRRTVLTMIANTKGIE